MNPLILGGVIAPILFIVFIAVGMPIGFSLFFLGFGGLIILRGWDPALYMLGTLPWSATAKFLLVIVPMFIIMGHFALSAGLSSKAYQAMYRIAGNIPGSLAVATQMACGLFAAVTGSSAATTATIGKVAIPEMEKRGYRSGFAAGAVCAGGTLGILIPPSVILVIYGMITNLSIGRLLIAGFLPGFLSIAAYSALIMITARFDPGAAPPGPSTTIKEKVKAVGGTWGFILLIVIVMGSIYTGWATPTQAGALGAFAAFVMAVPAFKKRPRELREALNETVLTTSFVFIIIAGATVFTTFLSVSGVTLAITKTLLSWDVSALAILIALLAFYIVLGMFLDPIAILLITVPLAFPVLTGLGYDGIWFGIIVTKMIGMGYLTPPFGYGVFITKGLAPHIPIETIFKEAMKFLVADVVVVALLIIFPQIATILPSLMFE